MLGTTLHHRFRLEQVLHRAYSGPLYLATDERTGEMLAVKLFPPAVDFSAEDGLRYRRAMERIAALSHPHLLAPRFTGVAEGLAFQVLPYYPGDDLQAVLADGALEPAQVVALLRQAAQALEVLHAQGVAHLNLKPSNLLISRAEGDLQAVLCDPLRHLPCGLPDDPAGAAWLAPEQTPWLELEPDGRADLYALGTLAFHALTGSPPFAAATFSEMLHQHVVAQAPDVRQLRADVPGGLAAIVARLLAKQPRDRYQSAAGLLADLAHWESAPPGGRGHTRSVAVGREPFTGADWPPGREAAREALLSSLARAAGGQGALVCLASDDGAGPRALLRDVLPHLEAARALLLRAAAPPDDACAPYQVPADLLNALVARWEWLPDPRRREILSGLHTALGDGAAVVNALVPAMHTLLPHADEAAPLPMGRAVWRTLHVLCEAFIALAEPQRPLVLWIEDVHGADPDSRAWLRHLARRLRGHPVLVVACGEGTADWLVPPADAQDGATGTDRPRIELPPPTREALAGWLTTALGAETAPPATGEGLPERLAAWLSERWGGHSTALALALRLLLAKRLLRPLADGAGWQCNWAELEGAAWPESLAALVQHSLELLPDETLPVLQALAVHPGGCTFAELAAQSERLPPPLLLEQIEAALAAGLLYRQGGVLRIASEAVRQGTLRAMPQTAQRELHLAAGGALEARPGLPPLLRLHRAALHFRVGGDEGRFVEHGCRLVEEAGRQQALRGQVAWSERLLPRLRADPRLPALLIAAGAAHAQLGQAEQALSLLGSARALELPEPDELEAIACAAWAEQARGRRSAALALVEEGLSRAGEALPANPMGTALARLSAAAVRRYESIRSAAQGAPPVPLTPRERRLCELLTLASRLLAEQQPFRAALADERILSLAAGALPGPHLVGALLRLGEAGGDPEGAPFRQAREILQRTGLPHAQAAFHAASGRCRLAGGQWEAAGEALQLAWSGFQRIGAFPDEAETLPALLELARLRGALPRVTQTSAALHGLAGLLGDAARAAEAAAWGAWASAMGGRLTLPRAVEVIGGAARTVAAAGRAEAARGLLSLAGELALAAGDLGAFLTVGSMEADLPAAPDTHGDGSLRGVLAEGHLVQARLLPEESDYHLAQAGALLRTLRRDGALPRADQARIAVLERFLLGDGTEALRLAQEALERLEEQGLALAAALLRRHVAEGLQAAGDPSWLHWGGQALTAFDTLEARLHLQAMRRLLGLDEPEQRAAAESDDSPQGAAAAARWQAAGLPPLLERIAQSGALDDAALREALLAVLLRAADAEFAAYYAPEAAGGLTCLGTLPAGLPPERLNRWLAETVWRKGRAEALPHYRAPADERSLGGALPEAHSFLGVALESAGGRHGVVVLGSAAARLVFDEGHVRALVPLSREAGTLLDLNARLGSARQLADGQAQQGQRNAHLLRWATYAAEGERLEDLLAAYGAEALWPHGFAGALLCLVEGDTLRLAAVQGNVPERATLEPPFPLALAGGQAQGALTRQEPVQSGALDSPTANAAEHALLQAIGGAPGEAALWLPLLRQGTAFGVVLAVGRSGEALPAERLEPELVLPLRLLAPAMYAVWRGARAAAEADASRQRATALEREAGVSRRWMPPGLTGAPDEIAHRLRKGIQRTLPVLAGEAPGLLPTGAAPAPDLLHAYYERVEHGLALHSGTLARVQHQGWIATYPGAVDGALWGAQTLYQLLLERRDEGTASGVPVPPTGLGLHLGPTLWSAVPAGEALLPLLTGPAIRTAARLAAMSIGFRCGLLVSEATVEALADRARFDLRHLGKLRPAAGDPRIDVYELYSLREPEEVEPMRRLQEVWDEGVREFQRGRWQRAAGAFHRYAERLPQDRPARFFLRQCRLRSAG